MATEPVDVGNESEVKPLSREEIESILERALPIKAGTHQEEVKDRNGKVTDTKTVSNRLTEEEYALLERRHQIIQGIGEATLDALSDVPELQVAAAKALLKEDLDTWPTLKFEREGKSWELQMAPRAHGFRLKVGDDEYSYRTYFRSDLGGNTLETTVNGDSQVNSPEAFNQFNELVTSIKPPVASPA